MIADRLLSAMVLRTCRSIAVLLIAAISGGVLLRIAPGSDVDERELVGRMSNESVSAIREQRARGHDLLPFVAGFVRDLANGQTPVSELYGQPVGGLIGERINATAVTLAKGLSIAWCGAILLAVLVSSRDWTLAAHTANAGTAILLSVPSGVLAVLCLLAQLPPFVAIGAVVFPRVFPVAEEQFRHARTTPQVIFARAKGLSASRVLFAHVMPSTFAPLVALAGVSVVLALGAAIPVETLLDSPGLGQLVWRAALGRDLPLLVTTTLIIAAVTIFVNWCVDLALLGARLRSL